VRGEPDLVDDYSDHEHEIEPQRPEDEEFRSFKVTARDGMLFRVRELIVFE
jgi:hypothetical protein